MTLGLPSSGKSTWSKQYQAEHPDTVRVNKDELRAMLHDGQHSKGRENLVLKVRDSIINQALCDGHDVIVDDTNFHPKHRQRLEQLAELYKAVVEVKDFTDVPLETCIERDLKRMNSVGERVIRKMHRQYLNATQEKVTYNPSLPDAIICDLDGTLAHFGDANPYDRDFSQDQINTSVKDILARFDYRALVFFSGRKEKFRAQTEQWLRKHGFSQGSFDFETIYYDLYMRPDNDNRKDVVLKEELYNEHVKGRYNVTMVIDDRLQVCRLWHRLGLPLFRVGDPDADF